MPRRLGLDLPALILAALVLGAPGAQAKREPVQAIQAGEEIPEHLLLDVGILILDPGLPEEDESALEPQGVFPEVRKSEARYIPYHLKTTLESTGQWGAVRVIPSGAEAVDVSVSGEILQSTGRTLSLNLRIVDSRGQLWTEKRYKQLADTCPYREDCVEHRDPYQGLYNEVANDLLAARDRLKERDLTRIREVSRLRFAANLVPASYGDYVTLDKKGRFRVERLPASDDPMIDRIDRIRERDFMFVDTLNEYYAEFYTRMDSHYHDWRRYSFEEQTALLEIRREARMKKILGGIMLLGAGLADGGSSAARVARDAATVGGAIAIAQGIQQSKEAKIHVEALKELAASFDSDMEPLLVDVEGQTLRLEGSAETQYAEWRRLLSEIFVTETGLPPERSADEAATLGATP